MKQTRRTGVAVYAAALVGASLLCAMTANAATMAYWRFEAGPADTLIPHPTGDGVFNPDVPDSSGNGNALSAWTSGAWANEYFRSDVPAATVPQTGDANNFSIQNAGSYPGLWAIGLQTWQPTAWTIEAAFQPELTDVHRTLVGRDGRYVATVNGDLSALYFQIQPDESLAIKYCDVSGYWHEAISAASTVQGFVYPNSGDGQWQAAAAVCDGSMLSLYYKNVENGDVNYTLVASTDLTLSSSPNLALTNAAGSSGGDWTGGNFSVMRGLYAGGHGDRAYGFIDEVRISDTALTTDQFLFSIPEPTTAALGILAGLAMLFRRRFARG